MSDEILELRKENNALKEMNGKLEAKIAELSKEIEAMKSERSYRQSSAESTIDNHASQLMKRTHEGESSKIATNVKRPKLIIEILVPNWLVEVLAWINRIEMANSKLGTSSELFKQLCWPKLHLNVKPHKIQRMEFFSVHYELGNLRAFVRRKNYNEQFGLFSDIIPISSIIPIASIPAPDYIIGFEEINIKFMDEHVLNFIKSISRFLQDFKLDFKMQLNSSKMDKKQIASIHSLLEYLADKIFELMIHGPDLNYFHRIFPGILDQIQFLYLYLWESRVEIGQIDAILNWLTNPMNNRKQKILKSTCPKHEFTTELINRIKEDFSNSNSPSIFFIYFLYTNRNQNFEDFTLENTRTNEILNLNFKVRHGGSSFHLYLARYPKGEKHWKKEGKEKIKQQICAPSINIINI